MCCMIIKIIILKKPHNKIVKENLIKSEKINNIFKANNKYELNNERKKFKKGINTK